MTYTGITIDTVAGRIFIPPDKLAKLIACVQRVVAASTITPRDLDSVCGRLRHYSMCIRHLRPLVASLSDVHSDGPGGSLDTRRPV